MLFSKDTIEKQLAEELAVIQKKQEVEKWSKIADHMATIGGDKYTGPAVEKAFNKEKKDNFPHLASVDSVMAGAVGDENTLTKEDPVEGEADVGGNGGNTIEVEEEGSYSIEVERGIEMVNA